MFNIWTILRINSEKNRIKIRIHQTPKIAWKIRTRRLKIRLHSKADVHLVKYLIIGYLYEDIHFYVLPYWAYCHVLR